MSSLLFPTRPCWLALVGCCLASVVFGMPPPTGAHLTLVPCDAGGVSGQCGTFEVFENRLARSGRKIALKVVVLPATGADRAPDPLVFLAGGPGGSATAEAPHIAMAFTAIRQHRDFVFVDQRGSGGSHPLGCDLYDPADLQSYLGPLFPLDAVRRCRQQLERSSDLTLYTTTIAMDDLDEVTAALGYSRLNLFGASYGTRAALVYLKRHPERVRSVMLQGVSPTDVFVPRSFAPDNERALRGVLAECAADAACHQAFPDPHGDIAAAFARLAKGPVEVALPNPGAPPGLAAPASGGTSAATNSGATVKLSRDRAAEATRFLLSSPDLARRLPLMLHLAAEGNFAPLAQAVLAYRRLVIPNVSTGQYLSITCAEDVPWIRPGEGEKLAAGTLLGDYSLRQLRQACDLWPRAAISHDYSKPTRSSAPVLMLTGEWDPVTPPANGDAIGRYLPNGLHVVVPHGGHELVTLEDVDCITRLQAEFVERGRAKGLDVSCVKDVARRGFVLSPQSPQ